jgi:hypothetical protein
VVLIAGPIPVRGPGLTYAAYSRNNGEWAFRTGCAVHAASRMMGRCSGFASSTEKGAQMM